MAGTECSLPALSNHEVLLLFLFLFLMAFTTALGPFRFMVAAVS